MSVLAGIPTAAPLIRLEELASPLLCPRLRRRPRWGSLARSPSTRLRVRCPKTRRVIRRSLGLGSSRSCLLQFCKSMVEITKHCVLGRATLELKVVAGQGQSEAGVGMSFQHATNNHLNPLQQNACVRW